MSPDQTRRSPEPFNFQTYSSPDEPGPSSYQSPDAAQLDQDDFNVSFLSPFSSGSEQDSVLSTSLWSLTRITHALVGTAPWVQPARVPAARSPLRRLPATDPPVCDPHPRRYVVAPASRPHLDNPRDHFKADSTFLGWGLWDEVSQLSAGPRARAGCPRGRRPVPPERRPQLEQAAALKWCAPSFSLASSSRFASRPLSDPSSYFGSLNVGCLEPSTSVQTDQASNRPPITCPQ